MISSIAFALLGAAAVAGTPCENLASLKLSDATITSAVVVPEGPPPARGGGGGGGRGGGAGARGGDARGGAAAPQAQRGAPPANIPAHCRIQLVLKPTSDSLINME